MGQCGRKRKAVPFGGHTGDLWKRQSQAFGPPTFRDPPLFHPVNFLFLPPSDYCLTTIFQKPGKPWEPRCTKGSHGFCKWVLILCDVPETRIKPDFLPWRPDNSDSVGRWFESSRAHQTGRWKRYWGRNLCVFNPSKARRLENLRAFLSLSPQSSLRQVSNLRLVLVEYVFAKPGSLKQNLGFFNTETTGWQIEAKLVPFIDCISITVFKEGLTNYRLFPIMIPASEVKPWAIQLWWLMTSRWF